AMISAADSVVAGNSWLREQALLWAGPENVRVIPTCVDVGCYPVAQHERTQSVELVWIGSSSTLQGLERARPLWESIGAHCPAVKLRLVCDRFVRFERLPVIQSAWSEETEATELASADIGVSWVPDDDWSRGK